jgi:xanthine dehydrogenase accessory factor
MTDAPEIMIVGDGPVADALVPMVAVLGWRPLVTTDLEAVHDGLGSADAVVVLSHHEGLDAPAIRAALEHGTAYVGAMGSRKTQARRRDQLEAGGVGADLLARLRAPIGLDIGADEPGEIAVSILAEVVAVRRGASGSVTAVSERDGAIHPDLAPGTATCPGG